MRGARGDRSTWGLVAWLLLLCAFVAAPAEATLFEEAPADCATCEQTYRSRRVTGTNTYGGIDADGCRTANGDTPWGAWVQVCTHCLAARALPNLEVAAEGEAAAAFLRKAAQTHTVRADAGQDAIPIRTRFKLACGLMEAEQRPARDTSFLWLVAAWAARGDARAALLHPEDEWSADVPSAWRDLRAATWEATHLLDRHAPGARSRTGREIVAARAVADADASDPVDVALRRLHVAAVLRCHGELLPATEELNAIALPEATEQTGDDEQRVRDWIAATSRALVTGIEEERAFLERALWASVSEDVGPDTEVSFGDLRRDAECLRRLGRDAAATTWFLRAARADPDSEGMTDADLVLLRDAAEWAGSQTPSWRDAVVAAWDARVDALVLALSDAEVGEDAAERLAGIGAARVLDRLVALLDDEDAGPNAAAALAGYPPPPAEVVAAIEARAVNEEVDLFTRWNLLSTLVAWAEPSSAATFRAALSDEDLLEHALRGLGRTGTQADVPAILARAREDPETSVEALSLLVGRAFGSLDAFRAWWSGGAKENGNLAHAALREAGVDVESLEDPEAATALTEVLVDARRPVRWAAFRTLRTLTSHRFGAREILYVGRVQNPQPPGVDLDLERAVGDGWTVSYRGSPAFDMDDMGPAMQPMRDEDGRRRWERAQARWRHGLGATRKR